MPGSRERRAELSDFLRGRRERLSPQQVGLAPGNGRRRTQGLRREEVAVLADVSPAWYTFLEQGRDVRASPQVLEALARALRLDPAERAHLFLLARSEAPPQAGAQSETVLPALAALLGLLEPNPAFVTGRRWDVLDANRPARELFTDWLARPADQRNMLTWVFTEPRAREVLVDWEQEARALLGRFRAAAGRYVEDPAFTDLIDTLQAASAEFRTWWARHDVIDRGSGSKAMAHPRIGRVTLNHTALNAAENAEQRLVVYYAEPGSPDAARLRELLEPAHRAVG
ncbi:helix-turn-helix domain-containing protein [Actinospica durhamensis]|uniref:Helix-turn-helix domain-containing protein n=1 Tax=Actinospica durhamensis TaxID=1508375 RepID=A0A941EUS1_9ACTN|nr:helix-turn-helix transcriptional regulator [Actinospica durhamensis]MBR7837661.1 helix-turn-helix domain-containing protein [Actinospica durhamensis]